MLRNRYTKYRLLVVSAQDKNNFLKPQEGVVLTLSRHRRVKAAKRLQFAGVS